MKKFSLWPWSSSKHGALQADRDDSERVVDSITLDGGKKFGIRSYLHQFYLASPTVEEFDNPNAWYLLPPPPAQRISMYVCRIITFIGLLLLFAGAGLIIVGYTWNWSSDFDAELTRISITQNEDGDFFIDKEHLDELLNPVDDKWRLAGFIVFAIGGGVIAVSLMIPSCMHFCNTSKLVPFSGDNTPNEAPVRIFPSASQTRFKVSKTAGGLYGISPTSGSSPVPAMQEITNIQPGAKRSAGNSPTTEDLLLVSESEALLH